MFFFTHDRNFQNDPSLRVFWVQRTSAPQIRCIFSWGTHLRSIYERLSILCIALNVLEPSQAHQMTDCFRKFHYFSLILIEFHWFSLIFIDFHWFLLISIDFLEHLSTSWWHWPIQISTRSLQTAREHLKMESSCKNTSKLWCGSPLDSKYSQ